VGVVVVGGLAGFTVVVVDFFTVVGVLAGRTVVGGVGFFTVVAVVVVEGSVVGTGPT
jgi:hypothetical protein